MADRWEIAMAKLGSRRLAERLDAGWEPFAVEHGHVFLRRPVLEVPR